MRDVNPIAVIQPNLPFRVFTEAMFTTSMRDSTYASMGPMAIAFTAGIQDMSAILRNVAIANDGTPAFSWSMDEAMGATPESNSSTPTAA